MKDANTRLIIKSPSDVVASHYVAYDPSWSVKDLKEHLSETYPSHPAPQAQRLIYAGKLLSDGTILSTLFKDLQVHPTVHLVCRNTENSGNSQDGLINSSTSTSSSAPIESITPDEMQQYQRQYYEYLRSFYMSQGHSTVIDGTNLWSYPTTAWPYPSLWGVPGGPTDNSLCDPVSAGFHSNPVSTQAVPNEPNPVAQQVGPDWNVFNRAAPEREPAAPAAQQQGAQQPQAMMVGNPMAAGFMGGEELGENAGNLDIVDRFYMIFRLTLFVSLCFAYSSLDKAIIVFSVAAYVYFYNIYRRHAALRRAAAAVVARATNEPQPSPSPNNAPSTAERAGPSDSVSTSSDQPTSSRLPATSVENPPPTADMNSALSRFMSSARLVFAIFFQFFSSLITSLIPEQPPPIRLD